jgi:hypothetical protein
MRYAFLAAVLAAAGCGPLQQPIPARLDDHAQKDIDAAWNAALTPVGRYDRGRWLDALVGTHAYQVGVDTFTLRSEKTLAAGRVVMEIHTDRARPDDDRFVVTVYDAAGVVARQERYSRADVEQAVRDLHPNDGAGDTRRTAAAEARWKQVQEMFPVRKDGPK